jgi:SnoaL-like domain
MKNTFLAYVEAINSGDINAALALIAPDAQLINSKYRPSVPAEGFELIKTYIQETVISQNGRITVSDLLEKEDTVEAQIELRSDRIKRAGFERILGTERFTMYNQKIKGFEFTMNLGDAETKQFFDFVRNLEANRPK